jgi:hypothetical protein
MLSIDGRSAAPEGAEEDRDEHRGPIGSQEMKPKKATWIASVLEYAMPRVKLRSVRTCSSSAVPAVSPSAPSRIQPMKLKFGAGSAKPPI